MIKAVSILVVLLGLAGAVQAQTVSLHIDAGLLENTTGTAVVANGMLLQILASPSGVFSAPTSSAYVTGDNVLLGNFAMNSNSGNAGETLTNANNLSLATFNLTVGEAVELRFYPNLSGTTVPATPTLGTTYGQVRSSTTESGQTDGSQTAWVIPAAGVTADLLYITANDGGVYSNLSAQATNIVAAAIPEPSTYALFSGGFLGLLGLCAWNRRKGLALMA